MPDNGGSLAAELAGLSVLLVEDERYQQDQIRECLGAAGFNVETASSGDEERLLNYKAGHSDCQIVIVDLDLGGGATNPVTGGIAVIMDRIWPLDRTAVFVVFSQVIHSDLDVPRELGRVEPQFAFVEKRVESDGSISLKSLEDLTGVLIAARRVIISAVTQSHYTALGCLHWLHSYALKFEQHSLDVSRLAQMIVHSVDRLNELGREAISYARIGADAGNIVVGVYGSAGRLESRPDSDLEFSVYPESDNPDAIRLSVGLWNRMFIFCQEHQFRPEGEKVIAKNVPKLLLPEDAKEWPGTKNAYAPILPATWLVDEKPTKFANVRNRHRQLFFETRAVFNDAKLREIKMRILNRNVLKAGPDAVAIFGAQYWEDMLQQFHLDSALRQFQDRNDIKTFCYRTMGNFAVRLYLIEQILLHGQDRLDPEGWDVKLDEMCQPALVKLLRFAVRFSERDKAIGDIARSLVSGFASLLVRMNALGFAKVDDNDELLIQECLKDARQIAEKGIELISKIRRHPMADAVRQREWLLNCPEFASLTSRK